jgi:hypothetical protein
MNLRSHHPVMKTETFVGNNFFLPSTRHIVKQTFVRKGITHVFFQPCRRSHFMTLVIPMKSLIQSPCTWTARIPNYSYCSSDPKYFRSDPIAFSWENMFHDVRRYYSVEGAVLKWQIISRANHRLHGFLRWIWEINIAPYKWTGPEFSNTYRTRSDFDDISFWWKMLPQLL